MGMTNSKSGPTSDANQRESDAPESDTICPICLDDMETKDEVESTSCGHSYHSRCLQTWFSYNSHCPLCRTLINRRSRFFDAYLRRDNSSNSLTRLHRMFVLFRHVDLRFLLLAPFDVDLAISELVAEVEAELETGRRQ